MKLESYIETALWSSLDHDGNEMDSQYSINDLDDAFLKQCQAEMEEFLDKARHLFTDEELESSPIEHDFWLTRNRHGAGFWDGDYKNGNALTEVAIRFGEVDLMEHLNPEHYN